MSDPAVDQILRDAARAARWFEKVAEARALLRQVEWAGDPVHHVCPACQRMRMHGHDPDCALARVLREDPDAPKKDGERI